MTSEPVTPAESKPRPAKQEGPKHQPQPQAQAGPQAPRLTHQSELEAAEKFLYGGKVRVEDLNFIRFFTTFAIPEKYKFRDRERVVELRHQAELCLPFALNSVASVNSFGFIEKPKRVPGSDTLWYVDIRDFGWKEDDIDAVFKLQPYFLTPLVDGKNPAVMFRADWFIVNALDV